jgi:hypothetical protein
VLLLVIVLLTGTEVRLNPQEIVALVEAREADDPLKRYSPEVRCIVETTDGKDYATKEECHSISVRLDELKARQP